MKRLIGLLFGIGLALPLMAATTTEKLLDLRAARGTTVKTGEWHAGFTAVRNYAETKGLPLIAVWSNGENCSHCIKLEKNFLNATFKNWMTNSGVVFYFGCCEDKAFEDGYGGTAYAWCWKNESLGIFPFVRFYWKAKKGTRLSDGTVLASDKVVVDKAITGDQFDNWLNPPEGAEYAVKKAKSILSQYVTTETGIASMTVTYDANGGTPAKQTVAQTASGAYTLKVSEPTRSGYVFNGWWSAKSGGVPVTTETALLKTTSHSVYAQWRSAVKVTFDPDGGKVSETSRLYSPVDRLGVLPLPVRSGYDFAGWYWNGQWITIDDMPVNATGFALKARWTPKSYLLTLDPNGGSCGIDHIVSRYGLPLGELPVPVRTGFRFGGWYDALGNHYHAHSTMPDATLTLMARWGLPVTVRLVIGNESREVELAANCPFGDLLANEDPGEPPAPGLELLGWSTVFDSEDVVKPTDLVPAKGVALYPVWRIKSPWPSDGAFSGAAARTYDGYVWNGETVIGRVTVSTEKWTIASNKKSTNTTVKVSLKLGSTSYSYTGGKISGTSGVVTSLKVPSGAPKLALTLGLREFEGTCGDWQIIGARRATDVFYQKSWNVTLGFASEGGATVVTGRLQVKVASDGTAKIAGTTATGAAFSASARVIVGADAAWIPFVSGGQTVLVQIGKDGSVALIGSMVGEAVKAGATEKPSFVSVAAGRTSMVGVPFVRNYAINELAQPVKFTAVGLPEGLKINASTGAITGVPTKSGAVKVKVTVTSKSNAKWTATRTETLTIAALPGWAKGTFAGLLEDASTGRDGSVSLTISSVGKLSGKVTDTGISWTLSAASFSADSVTVGETNLVLRGKASYKQVDPKTQKTVATYYEPYDLILRPPASPSWSDSAVVGRWGDAGDGTAGRLSVNAVRFIGKDANVRTKLLSQLKSKYTIPVSETVVATLKPAVDTDKRRTGQMTITAGKRSLSVPILYDYDPQTGEMCPYVVANPIAGEWIRIPLE